MKEKMQTEIIRIGSSIVNQNNLNVLEAISMGIVTILALTAGTMLGDKLF